VDGARSQLAELNEELSRHATGPAGISLHTLQRHREILHDYSAEFQKTRAAIKAARERASLLDSVRSDIRDFRNSETPVGGRQGEGNLLRERNALHHAVRMADEVIGRAHSTQGSLHEQRSALDNIRRNVVGLGQRIPALGSLINMISARKQRDALVLGGTGALCFVMLFWLTFM
jgi:Golgi SNAP receptor complex protein 1